MSTRHYSHPVEQTEWKVPGSKAETVFTWEYDEGRDKLLSLYEKGKDKQWNATHRIDWSHELDPENPLGAPEAYLPIFGSKAYEKMNEAEKIQLRNHLTAVLVRHLKPVAQLAARTRSELRPGTRTVLALSYRGRMRGPVTAVVRIRIGARLAERRYRLRL